LIAEIVRLSPQGRTGSLAKAGNINRLQPSQLIHNQAVLNGE
jgi:hypothetical protein